MWTFGHGGRVKPMLWIRMSAFLEQQSSPSGPSLLRSEVGAASKKLSRRAGGLTHGLTGISICPVQKSVPRLTLNALLRARKGSEFRLT